MYLPEFNPSTSKLGRVSVTPAEDMSDTDHHIRVALARPQVGSLAGSIATNLRTSVHDGRATIIVLANSARAIAASAKRAGFAALAVDVFGDEDTREMSLSAMKLEGGLAAGLTPDKVADAVETLVGAYDPIGLVYGSGFEHQPEAIAAIARVTRIFGNSADTIRRAKDPMLLAQLCASAGISHPPIALATPEEPELWLTKTRGGAGGAHVVPAALGRLSTDRYFQRFVSGESVSALFVADGRKNRNHRPQPAMDFANARSRRFDMAALPGLSILAAHKRTKSHALSPSSHRNCGLVGLNSADFIVSRDAVWLIEVNPRLGATLDLFEPVGRALFAIHIAGCEGHAIAVPNCSGVRAAGVVYAPHDMVMSHAPRNWPDWTADRPPPGTRVRRRRSAYARFWPRE